MSSANFPDHAVFWADNADIRGKTEAYYERVMKALATRLVKKDTRHPWMNHDTPVDCKIRIFELYNRSSLPSRSIHIHNPQELLEYWENTSADDIAEGTRQRVIILEDMNPRSAELLGVMLDIPPEVFLAHCEEFSDLSVVDRSCAKRGSSTYWKVRVPQKRSLPEGFGGPYGACYLESGTFDRGGLILTEDISYFSFQSVVSYWGKAHEDGSWTAVLMIDPHTAHLRIQPSDSATTRVCLEDWEPVRTLCHEVMLDCSEIETVQPYERSMFKAIEDAHSCAEMTVTDDPFSATIFARNFIRATWEEHICRDEWSVHDTLFEDERQHQGYRGTNASQDLEVLAYEDNKTGQAYQKLMKERQTIQETSRVLRDIIWKFRCRDTVYLSQQSAGVQNAMQEEGRVWTFLQEKLQSIEAIIGDHIAMYSQRAAMEESFAAKVQAAETNQQTAAANRMARSSGQLTKIATIIVPCTFVASIFSMGGNFAAGGSLFFVYWAISVPITLALLVWVVFGTHISKPIENLREQMIVRRVGLGERKTLMKDKISKIGWRRYFFNFSRGRPARDEEKGK